MCAFVYALNDTDERVRREAADQIGCQIRKHGCCCSPEVVAALTCALGDCDKHVRKLAEKALCCCGYEVVDGCCDTCGDACGVDCAPAAAGGPTHVAPPAPPTDATTFKSKLNIRSVQTKSKLANLFGLAR
jgi:hypothetical protein